MSRQSPVSEVMTTDVLTFSPDDNVADAMQVLVDRGIDGAPVVTAAGEVVGMLSTGDLIVQESKLHFPTVISLLGATLELPSSKKHFDEDLRRTLGSTVGQVMQTDPVTIGVDDTIEEAATLLHRHEISRMPVVGDSGLVGIVSRVDILRGIISDDASA
ncbi:MAG TPA: CBS domain-containing protein [Aquihabitans sp.]|jgi:CBS domain-containing protein|nr:CBS domain-containing protein [Aquihabitans sp.]